MVSRAASNHLDAAPEENRDGIRISCRERHLTASLKTLRLRNVCLSVSAGAEHLFDDGLRGLGGRSRTDVAQQPEAL